MKIRPQPMFFQSSFLHSRASSISAKYADTNVRSSIESLINQPIGAGTAPLLPISYGPIPTAAVSSHRI